MLDKVVLMMKIIVMEDKREQVVSTKFKATEVEQIDTIAQKIYIPRSTLIRKIVMENLDKYDPENK